MGGERAANTYKRYFGIGCEKVKGRLFDVEVKKGERVGRAGYRGYAQQRRNSTRGEGGAKETG